MKAFSAAFLVLSVTMLWSVEQTEGWGVEGHKIVAQLAWNRLSSQSQKVSKQLMGSKSMADIAPVPDTYRSSSGGKWSAPCHYYDLPRVKAFTMDYCTGLCVVKSVTNYTKLLATELQQNIACDWTKGVEPCALSFLVHYVGDIHQPLHVSYGDDKGGNDVKVKFFDKSTNLHSVWDNDILQKWNNEVDSAVSDLESIIKDNPDVVQKYLNDTNPEDWGAESFGYVLSTVYNFTDSMMNYKSLRPGMKADPYLGQQYYDTNLPVVQQRLIAGGVRLGLLLDNILS